MAAVALACCRANDPRDTLVKVFLLCGTATVVCTEALSLFQAINATTLGVFWVVASGLALARLRGHARLKGLFARSPSAGPRLPLDEAGCRILCGIFIATTFGIALLAPPNTWDAMTYHMPRVAHWIQQQSVSFFPASIERQNYQPPFAEFVILHLQLLAGGDRYANLVQWCGYVMCILLVSRVVAHWGGNAGAQWLGALMAATLPMAVLQSTGAKNDLLESAFCLAFAYGLMRQLRQPTLSNLVYCGLALGLALLTKGTGYIYCGALGTAYGLYYLLAGQAAGQRARRIGELGALLLVAAALNAGHYARSYQHYGAPLHGGEERYVNASMSPANLAGNLARNLALHIGTGAALPDYYLNRAFSLALGSQATNPDTTYPDTRFVVFGSRHEDYSGNPLHLALALLGAAVFALRRAPQAGEIRLHVAAVVGAVLLFCLMFRWQPWHSRLHTPMFMLAMPLAGLVVGQWLAHRQRLAAACALLVALASLPVLLANPSRPLLAHDGFSVATRPRLVQYFSNRLDLYPDYLSIAGAIAAQVPAVLHVWLRNEDWEYPLWVLLDKHAMHGLPRIEHLRAGAHPPRDVPAGLVLISTSLRAALPERRTYRTLLRTPSLTLLMVN